MPASLSRQFARWVADLRFDDLPPAVVDRAKGVTLQALASALVSSKMPQAREALQLMREEEDGGAGVATVLVNGTMLTRAGAAFVNAEMMLAGGKWDTFRMLTHPGTAIIPAGLVAAELERASGQEYITGIAAAYEVMERLAAEFIPTVMARGFHPGPVFSTFGAAIAAAKITQRSEDEINDAIGHCVSLAAGNVESARSGGRAVREGTSVRNGLLAVAIARQGIPAGETTLEGEAGFYHSYAGSNDGKLTYSFSGRTRASLEGITEGLGTDWRFLETLYRIYSTAGYNIAHIDVTAKLCEEHNIDPENVERVEAVVNWLETQYPSPAFPSRVTDGPPRIGSTQYFAAYGVVERGFPLLRTGLEGGDPPAVLDLMTRVTLIPSHTQTLFGPKVTIYTKDGKSYTREGTGREFIWDFDEEARRIRGVVPGIPISPAQFEDLIGACAGLEDLTQADRLIQLTLMSQR